MWDKSAKPERPVLRVWSLTLLVIVGLIPILNIALALCVIAWWIISVHSKYWKFTKEDNKLLQFLNKPIG